jgi:hypothetical protein
MGFALFGLGIIALLALAAGGGSASQKAGAAQGDARSKALAVAKTLQAVLIKYAKGTATEAERLAGADLASKVGLPKTASSFRFSTPLPSDEFLPGTGVPVAKAALG